MTIKVLNISGRTRGLTFIKFVFKRIQVYIHIFQSSILLFPADMFAPQHFRPLGTPFSGHLNQPIKILNTLNGLGDRSGMFIAIIIIIAILIK